MKRRITIKRVAASATVAAGLVAMPIADAVANEKAKAGPQVAPAKAKPTRAAAAQKVRVAFKGQNFEVTEEQKQIFDTLPQAVVEKLGTPVDGKVMPIEELQAIQAELKTAGVVGPLAGPLPGSVKIETIMCPW